jgi:hypothetical protein
MMLYGQWVAFYRGKSWAFWDWLVRLHEKHGQAHSVLLDEDKALLSDWRLNK